MARRKKFTIAELEGHLEMIDIYWHRHGDEEQGELEDYLRALYDALPEDRRELSPAEADREVVEVDLEEFDRLLYSALDPVFDETDVAEEIKGFVIWLEARSGRLSDDTITVTRAALREVFDLRFNSEIFNSELMEKLKVVRGWLKI